MAANPSAVYAMEKFGNYEIVNSDRGQYGIVRLPDGSLWEAWTLYRAAHDPKSCIPAADIHSTPHIGCILR